MRYFVVETKNGFWPGKTIYSGDNKFDAVKLFNEKLDKKTPENFVCMFTADVVFFALPEKISEIIENNS